MSGRSDRRDAKPPPELQCTEDTGGYLICRMVQVLVYNTMKNAKPVG